jgi:hypothetical protein
MSIEQPPKPDTPRVPDVINKPADVDGPELPAQPPGDERPEAQPAPPPTDPSPPAI